MRHRTVPAMAKPMFTLVAFMTAMIVSSAALAQDKKADSKKADAKPAADAPKADANSIGYFLGLSMGQQLTQSGIRLSDFNQESLTKGFTDGMNKKDAAIPDDLLRETQKQLQVLLQERRAEMIAAVKAKGVAYLAANEEKEGVKTLKSGLQYKVIKAGDGESPQATDTVKVHYTGKLINGKTFDSSVARGEPATFRVDQVIKGWQEGLQEMKEGGKWMLYVPSDMAYGPRGSQPSIGPHQVLIFEVELLEIQ